jgi:hypothetical protein
MDEVFLSQDEADGLISMPKQRVTNEIVYLPGRGVSKNLLLESEDHQERFSLDIYRGRIDLSKLRYQNRGREVVVLLRLDLLGPIHTNPDGVELPCPHLHIYRQGYRDKWAFPIPSNFTNIKDAWQTLQEFMHYCNIIRPPEIQRGAEDWNDK